jgi:hypothetical protein
LPHLGVCSRQLSTEIAAPAKQKFSAPLEIFQGAHRFAICTWLSNNKQKSYKIMKMKMFATLDKANRDIGNIKGLNLAAVKQTTVQVTRLLL